MKPSHELFRLIKSLTKSEKRFFKLMSSLQSGEKNYIKLFDAIEKQSEYDEDAIKRSFKGQTFIKHLPSEKNHLYKLILKSLRLFYAENSVSAILAEHIQSIEILYNKALYAECGKLVRKAKKIAASHERFYYLFELIKWEKMLLEEEFQFGNFDKDLNKLVDEEQQVIKKLRNLAEYQILYSKINYVFRQGSYVRGNYENDMVDEIKSHALIQGKNTALSRRAAATCYYIKGLCAITSNEVDESFLNFSRVVGIFEENPNLIQDIPKQYIKSLGNLFNYYIVSGDYERLFDLIKKMRSLKDQSGFNRIDIEMRIFLSTHYHELLAYEKMGNYDKALKMIDGIELRMKDFGEKITKEDEVVMQYLFTNVYFGSGKYREALRQLNQVLNDNETNLRQDIYNFSRLFNLIIHYELGNFDLLDYLIKSTERFYNKQRKSQIKGYEFEVVFIQAFKRLLKANRGTGSTADALKEMKVELTDLLQNEKERIALEYFDYITWLDSKLTGTSFAELKRRKS